MNKKFAIRGHETRGKEVIEILEMLGGKNQNNVYTGKDTFHYYFIDNETGYISTKLYTDDCWTKLTYNIFTLEDFLEKFPYKVGDKVIHDGEVLPIIGMKWDFSRNIVIYTMKSNYGYGTIDCYDCTWMRPYKEETFGECIEKT